jgi:hypothetical protein
MKHTTMLGLAMMAAVGLTACGDASINPSPNTRFVPGDRALDNDPCEHEFATGHECVRRGDICPDGGNRPSVMQCILGTWRCVIDTTRTCQRPAMPTCPDVQDTNCNLGFCPDGSPVPAQITCVSGRNICLPVAPGCPRVEPDAGVTPDSGTRPEPARLTVNLGSNVNSRTIVKNATADSVELVFTADPTSDLLVSRVRVRGIGDVSSGLRMADLQRVITSCTVRDGDTQIGLAMVPDLSGMMEFRNLNLVVRRGSTRMVKIRCTMDSVVEQQIGDRFALGIATATDVEAEDINGDAPIVTIGTSLESQLRFPAVVMTVLRSGSYTVTSVSMSSRDFTGGTTDWQVVGTYEIVSTTENVSLDYLAMQWGGNDLCVNEVGIMSFTGGAPYGTARTVSGTRNVDIAFDRPMTLRTDSPTRIYLVARFNPTVDPTHTPVGCFPGSPLTFSLASNLTTGEWDHNYVARYNMRVTGEVSGERIVSESTPQVGMTAVIR